MYLSDLQNKDIISTKDGRKLGSIIDVEINEQGNIVNLIIEEKKSFKRIISSSDIKISFKDIAKIGEDVILVNVWYNLKTRWKKWIKKY